MSIIADVHRSESKQKRNHMEKQFLLSDVASFLRVDGKVGKANGEEGEKHRNEILKYAGDSFRWR